jgi:hypothetical protein
MQASWKNWLIRFFKWGPVEIQIKRFLVTFWRIYVYLVSQFSWLFHHGCSAIKVGAVYGWLQYACWWLYKYVVAGWITKLRIYIGKPMLMFTFSFEKCCFDMPIWVLTLDLDDTNVLSTWKKWFAYIIVIILHIYTGQTCVYLLFHTHFVSHVDYTSFSRTQYRKCFFYIVQTQEGTQLKKDEKLCHNHFYN